jgi:hypothetical protein
MCSPGTPPATQEKYLPSQNQPRNSGPRMKPQQILPELTASAGGKSVLGSHTAKVLQTDDRQHRLQ